jgi:hypothetical protein
MIPVVLSCTIGFGIQAANNFCARKTFSQNAIVTMLDFYSKDEDVIDKELVMSFEHRNKVVEQHMVNRECPSKRHSISVRLFRFSLAALSFGLLAWV